MKIINIKNASDKQTKRVAFNPKVDNNSRSAHTGTLSRLMWYFSFILLLPIVIHVMNRNKLLSLQTKINQLASGIDIQLKQRRDTLLKLIDSVKSFTKYEKNLLTEVTKLRNLNIKNSNNDRIKLNDSTNHLFNRLLAIAENYPDLKSDNLVKELMEQASYLEREISAIRRLYNSEVQRFNRSLFIWPINIQATAMELHTISYFQASEEDIQDVKLNF